MKITKEEYSELVRQSERLVIISDIVANEVYVPTDKIKAVLGIIDKEED